MSLIDCILGNNKRKETYVRIVAHLIFAITSATFAFVFHELEFSSPGSKMQFWHLLKYIAIAITFWSSIHGAFDFIMDQSDETASWFRGLNLVTLSSSVFSCLLAMALFTNAIIQTIAVHLTFLFYLIWDALAFRYYKSRSKIWFQKYSILASLELVIFLTYTLSAYIPFVFPHIFKTNLIPNITPEQMDSFFAGITAFILFFQFIFFLVFSHRFHNKVGNSDERDELLSVEEGYRFWADVYYKGNAIITVERRHTERRLRELPIHGIIIDLGCGTGYYTEKILPIANEVIAIDRSNEMLDKMRERIGGSNKLTIQEGIVSNLHYCKDSSIDGIICCLVIDHIDSPSLNAMFHDLYRVLKPGGWVYITDVNAYFELREQQYAKFIDSNQLLRKIQVFPHQIEETLACFTSAQLPTPSVSEVVVLEEDTKRWEELENLVGIPLIIEYFVFKI